MSDAPKMEGANKLSDALGKGEACREKRWAELGIEEKVERLRQVLQRLEGSQDLVLPQFFTLREQFVGHEHGSMGQPVVNVPRHGGIQGPRDIGYAGWNSPSPHRYHPLD